MTDETPTKPNKGGRPKKRSLRARGDPANRGPKIKDADRPNRDHFFLENFADLRKRMVWDSQFAEEWFEMMGFSLLNVRDIAAALGYHEDHIHKVFREHPRLSDAFERGKARLKTKVIRALALEAICGNVKAGELVLERRFREEWGKKIEVSGNQSITYIVSPEDAACL